MSSHRALEVLFGVVTLVSVVSVPLPRRNHLHPSVSARPRIDAVRLEELERVSSAQRAEVARLTRQTRELSLMLQSGYPARDGGTVDSTHIRVRQPENEEYGCSQ